MTTLDCAETATPLDDVELDELLACWDAANYLTVGPKALNDSDGHGGGDELLKRVVTLASPSPCGHHRTRLAR